MGDMSQHFTGTEMLLIVTSNGDVLFSSQHR